ncbi:dihydropteroate synthase [Dyadobacter fermentans]|uniref:dihydropteroate synthase n=1 Tax=Dyadobacter fermentans (strain ATCC 700827 / DSM 18053 / CIP 107007 / KCTC 52180 / NS114) TaxID=471854 RepID=C6VX21_DYAFD|nr:dihydropteroate synthase [Dyadobacter fermentans]ACT91494.1 dihydropteroate synthase [Dyadobacter fermentans DSM 18053]
MLQVSKKTLNIRGTLLDLSTPVVMGIINITPDSFYAGSRAAATDEIVEKAGQMLTDGAGMIDIGGYSTRPGAREVGAEEEADRVESAVEPLAKFFPDLIISVDTFRAGVAERGIAKGAHIINDVAGGTLDDAMFETVARLRVPYILMHMRGTPQTMNQLTHYDRLVPNILRDLRVKVMILQSNGVADVIIDPGFGFAKTIAQNFELLRALDQFKLLGYPVLVGISRKKKIYKTLNISPDEALNGTTVLNTLALERGASILRVHDVKPAVEAVKLWMAAGNYPN